MTTDTKKQKILYIITKSNWGGAQRHVFDLATNVPKDKYDVVVAAGGSGPLMDKLHAEGIKTLSIGQLQRDANILKDSFSFLSIFRLIRAEKPDILHLHSPKAGGLGAFAGSCINVWFFILRSLNAKLWTQSTTIPLNAIHIIFTAHGWTYKEPRKELERLIIFIISWFTIILSHKTIVVSKDDFNKSPKFLTDGKITLIHNGILPFECLPRLEAQKEIFGQTPIYPSNISIGWIGELHKNKGLSYAIQAVGNIREQNADSGHSLILGAIGDGEERKNLEFIVMQSKLEKSVFFAGRKENGHKLLSAFDLFIFPSLKEGLPYALLEAGSVGLPLIATDVGGARDIITDMETGILIRPGDVKEISNALKFFIQNPEKIAEFGGRLKKKISEEFSLGKMVEKTVLVYEQGSRH